MYRGYIGKEEFKSITDIDKLGLEPFDERLTAEKIGLARKKKTSRKCCTINPLWRESAIFTRMKYSTCAAFIPKPNARS